MIPEPKKLVPNPFKRYPSVRSRIMSDNSVEANSEYKLSLSPGINHMLKARNICIMPHIKNNRRIVV